MDSRINKQALISDTKISYTNWKSGQPDQGNGMCVGIGDSKYGTGYQWWDGSCTRYRCHCFVCQVGMNLVTRVKDEQSPKQISKIVKRKPHLKKVRSRTTMVWPTLNPTQLDGTETPTTSIPYINTRQLSVGKATVTTEFNLTTNEPSRDKRKFFIIFRDIPELSGLGNLPIRRPVLGKKFQQT